MMITRKEIEAFLVRYGAALGQGDLETVVASWQAPGLVIGDGAGLAFTDAEAIARHFSKTLASGLPQPANPMLDGFDVFGKSVLTADVAWRRRPEGQAEKRFRYTLSGNDESGYRLRGMIERASPGHDVVAAKEGIPV